MGHELHKKKATADRDPASISDNALVYTHRRTAQHYENTPIQIYGKFHLQKKKMKIFR